jgi:succinoglycan biosynthesis protein ExoL
LLRCTDSIDVLGSLGLKDGRFKFILAGLTSHLDQERLKVFLEEKFVVNKGVYKPSDLPGLYRDVDLCWCCDWSLGENSRLLLPNRLYQGIKALKPIIANENTWLAKVVSFYEIGIVIPDDVDGAVDVLAKISDVDYFRWKENCLKISNAMDKVDGGWNSLFGESLSCIPEKVAEGDFFLLGNGL